ncbi:MAG: hypothetical protein AB1345_11520 [Chloroflexota bacterium]
MADGYYTYCYSPLISYHRWVCAKAQDNAGNTGYSSVQEFKIDPIKPQTPNIVSPGTGSAQTADFNVSVSGDEDTGDSQIDKCYYHVYDSSAGWTKSWAQRTCNGSFQVTVGANKDCRTNNGTCSIYVFSQDKAGNIGDSKVRTFNISLCQGNISLTLDKSVAVQGEEIKTKVSGLSSCQDLLIEIREQTGGGNLVSSCQTSGSGCTTSFSAPNISPLWEANFKYYARIDKNLNQSFTDPGETSSLVSLQVVNAFVACVDAGGCPAFVADSYGAADPGNWLGLIGTGGAGAGSGQLVSSCQKGSNSCQINGFGSGNNGQVCSLLDACKGTSQVLSQKKSGVWDVQNGCIVCSGKKQGLKIADASAKCFNLNCAGSSSWWSQLPCASADPGNGKCESACGAEADCDEKAVNEIFIGADNKGYKCDDTCQKVEVLPPLSKIISPDPNKWYSQDFSVSVRYTDKSGMGLASCYYYIYNSGGGSVGPNYSSSCISGTTPITTQTINFNVPVGAYKTCKTQGKDTCFIIVGVCDKAGNCVDPKDVIGDRDPRESSIPYGNYINYNIDYSAPEIKH